LEEIRSISQNETNTEFVKESLDLQLKLIRENISELKQIEQAILEVSQGISNKPEMDWNRMISLIHLLV
jgi:hypothetical protein